GGPPGAAAGLRGRRQEALTQGTTRTLPVSAPPSTASCAAAISSSGNLITGSSVSAPSASAAVMSWAAWSSASGGTTYSSTNLSSTLAVMQARTGSTGWAPSPA